MESPKVLSSAVLLAVFSTLTACGESDIELCNMAYDEADYSNAMEYCQRSKAISQPDALYIMGRILTEGLGGIEIKRDEGLDYLYRFLFVPGLSFSDYPYALDVLRELSNDSDFLGRHPDKAKKIIKKTLGIAALAYAGLFCVFYYDLDGKLLYYVVEPFMKNHFDNMERRDPHTVPYEQIDSEYMARQN